MIIRKARPEELVFIREQRVRAYEEHSNAVPTEHWLALGQAISSEADIMPNVELLVAELDEKIVGSVALFPPKSDAYEGLVDEMDYPEIRLLAVSPEARGKGVAFAMLTECLKRAKKQGYSYIGLHTADFMKNALKLYERFGFERLPQFDFEPANDGIIVKAFRLRL